MPLPIPGGLHATGEVHIAAAGEPELSCRPVLSGSVGTAGAGRATACRSMVPQAPAGLSVDERLPVAEENGSALADPTPEDITLRFPEWRHALPGATTRLEPCRSTRLLRA